MAWRANVAGLNLLGLGVVDDTRCLETKEVTRLAELRVRVEILCMEAMEEHCSLAFVVESFQFFSGGAGFRPFTVCVSGCVGYPFGGGQKENHV